MAVRCDKDVGQKTFGFIKKAISNVGVHLLSLMMKLVLRKYCILKYQLMMVWSHHN